MDGLFYEGLASEQVAETAELEETDNPDDGFEKELALAYEELRDISPEIRFDVPDCPVAYVTGDPFVVAEKLDYKQGDNPYNASGNCSLVSVSNICRIAGKDVSENDVTAYALANRLCADGWRMPESQRGGASDGQILAVMRHFGLEAKAFKPTDIGGDYEGMAQAIEGGRGVTMGLNAGYAWNDPRFIGAYGEVAANHQVTVTGAVRDAGSGKVAGFYICDSGRGLPSDACRYMPVSLLEKAYTRADGASVIITDKPIRA